MKNYENSQKNAQNAHSGPLQNRLCPKLDLETMTIVLLTHTVVYFFSPDDIRMIIL